MQDVTEKLLQNCSGPGEYVRRVLAAKPVKTLTPTLSRTLDELRSSSDLTMGFVSNVLAYSELMRKSKSWNRDLIRLIKGGFVRVMLVSECPSPGYRAFREAPYGDWYYVLEVK
jgi:hypothetical protein